MFICLFGCFFWFGRDDEMSLVDLVIESLYTSQKRKTNDRIHCQ